jgi:cAMP-dependent protein kinase regulator
MYNAPRAATIKCKKTGEVFKLDRQTFRNIVQEAAIKKRDYYSKIISKVNILSDMDSYERDQICDALREETFGPNEYVMKQG